MTSIAFATDIHGNKEIFNWLEEMTRKHDIVALGGDFDTGDPIIGKQLPLQLERYDNVIAVLGNHDEPKDVVDERIHHAEVVTLSKLKIGCLGGSLPVGIWGWPFENTEVQYSILTKQLGKVDILLTHQPPFGGNDILYNGQRCGSEAIYEYVITEKPTLLLSGHIHESAGIETIGSTTCVNPGPYTLGNYATIELKHGKVEPKLIGHQL